jgi:hypothetical protein
MKIENFKMITTDDILNLKIMKANIKEKKRFCYRICCENCLFERKECYEIKDSELLEFIEEVLKKFPEIDKLYKNNLDKISNEYSSLKSLLNKNIENNRRNFKNEFKRFNRPTSKRK